MRALSSNDALSADRIPPSLCLAQRRTLKTTIHFTPTFYHLSTYTYMCCRCITLVRWNETAMFASPTGAEAVRGKHADQHTPSLGQTRPVSHVRHARSLRQGAHLYDWRISRRLTELPAILRFRLANGLDLMDLAWTSPQAHNRALAAS